MIRKKRALRVAMAALLFAALAVGPVMAQTNYSKLRGYVDKENLTGLVVGEDDTHVEVWLPGSLLKLVAAVDPELGKLVAGLELAQAVVIETDDGGLSDKLTRELAAMESSLLKKGWVRLAKIKEGGENVVVLVLSDDEAIHGLTVMVSESGAGGSFVFANVVGTIDLAAIQQLGEHMDIPGLDQIRVEE
jgi:hypothetical protein